VPENTALDALQAWIVVHEEEERQRKEEIARLAEQRRRKELAGQIERFRAGDPDVSYICGISPMLRVVGDEVQTSLGARFPVSHALHALGLIRKIRECGREYVRDSHTIHLGHYAIDRIEPDGTVHAGCHVVKWDEIERIASQLVSELRSQE
jgi:hypothetical protein